MITHRSSPSMNEIINYINDIDISVLSVNNVILSKVLLQLKRHVAELAILPSTFDKIYQIFELCDQKLLMSLSKRFEIKKTIFNSFGSKIMELFVKKGVAGFLEQYVAKKFYNCLHDKNATFVVRELIMKGFNIVVSVDKIDFTKEFVLNTLIVYLKTDHDDLSKVYVAGRKRIIMNNKDNISQEKIMAAKQDIINHIIQTFFNYESLTQKQHSFFLEEFMNIVSDDQISKIYKKIKKDIRLLAANKYSNYMVQSFIKRYTGDIIDILNGLDFNTLHENIIIAILLKVQSSQNDELAEKIIIQYYGNLKSFLFNGQCINKRSLPIIKRMFMINNHNMSINCVFRENFLEASFAGNIECVRYYLMGNDCMTNKDEFIRKMFKHCYGKKGKQILSWMGEYCSYAMRKTVLNQLRKIQ